MAKRDVELVIRARNEASKAINTIQDAIGALVDSQNDLVKNGSRASNTLGELGSVLNDLSKAFKGTSVADKLAGDLEKAAKASESLKTESAELTKEQARLNQETKQAVAETERLTKARDESNAALERQKKEIQDLKKVQTELNGALTKSVAEQKALGDKQESITKQIERQQAAVVKAAATYGDLSQKLLATAEPTDKLKQRVLEASEALEKKEKVLQGLADELEQTRSKFEAIPAAIASASSKIATNNAVLEIAQKELAETSARLDEYRTSVKNAADHAEDLQRAAAKTGDALKRNATETEAAEKAIDGFLSSAAQAEAEVSKLGTAVRSRLLPAYGAQKKAVADAQEAFLLASAAAQNYAKELAQMDAPSQEAIDHFEDLKRTARALKDELLVQQEAFGAVRRAVREMGGDVASFVQAQQRVAAAQQQLKAALEGLKNTEARQALDNVAKGADTAATNVRRAGQGAREAGSAFRGAATESSAFSNALKAIYGDSRQAMSITQRLRGEILSLVMAYGGLFAAVQGVNQVIQAYKRLEQAQTRLNAAFNGNQGKVAQELDFIRRNAERLGFAFTEIAGEYGKFAIASQGTVLEGNKTRKLFVAVAEAARVNGLSMENMGGVLNALTQIMSKGKIQAEELRQQLGDRLPGAMRIMADGLGITTEQLDALMEKGEVSADSLASFADALNKKYGGALPKALAGLNVELGQLGNNAEAALLKIGQSGFIDSFTELTKSINEFLTSAQGQELFVSIGQGLSMLTDLLKAAIDNWELLAAAVAAFAGVKVGGVIAGLVMDINRLGRGLQVSALYAAASGNAASVAAGQYSLLGAGAARAAVGIRALMASSGLGIVVAGVAAALTLWGTQADDATEAMVAHRAIVDDVKNAYDKAGGSVEVWAKKIEKTTATQVESQIKALRALQSSQKQEGLTSSFGGPSFFDPFKNASTLFGEAKKQADMLFSLAGAYNRGKISVDEFRKAVDEIGKAGANERIKEIATALLEAADKSKDTEGKLKELEAVLRVLNGTATEADVALLGLKGSTENTGDAFKKTTVDLEKYTEALNELKSFIPGLSVELKKMKDLMTVDAAGMVALKNAIATGDINQIESAINLHSQARQGVMSEADNSIIKEIAGSSKITAETLQRIGKNLNGEEGFRNQAYQDQGGTWTIGFGSTRMGGRAVQAGDTITREDAIRQMVRDVEVFAAKIDGQITKPITTSMRDALISYAYNVGHVSESIIAAINRGDYVGAQAAIKNGVNTVKGVPNDGLTARRAREAELFGKDGVPGGDNAATYEVEKAITEEKRKQAELEAEKIAGRALDVEEQKMLLENEKLVGLEKLKHKALFEAELAAKKEGRTLTEQEKASIIEATNLEWQRVGPKEQAAAAEERVNQLLEVRKALQEQITFAQQQGDSGTATELQTRLEGVNAQLKEAIANAVQMWQAVGGPGADAAIAKLQTTEMTLSSATQGFLDWNRVGQMFASGLANAFDRFAQGIAEGQKATEAAREAFLQFAADFLRQIAQMIIQQAIMNLLKSAMPGLFGGMGVGVNHAGGLAGSSNRSRTVDPSWFVGAMRYHTGGVAGLKPNEVPTILEKGEEVLTSDDPRHRFNGGLSPAAPVAQGGGTKIINAFDSASFLEESLNSAAGEKAILNFVRANPGAFKQALGG